MHTHTHTHTLTNLVTQVTRHIEENLLSNISEEVILGDLSVTINWNYMYSIHGMQQWNKSQPALPGRHQSRQPLAVLDHITSSQSAGRARTGLWSSGESLGPRDHTFPHRP